MKSADVSGLGPEETLENLGNGLYIIQGREEFRFGTDAVRLADFAVVHPGERLMDLCTGTGIVPLLLCAREPRLSAVGLELQPQMAEMAGRSVKQNNFTDRLEILQGDVRQVRENFPAESFQVVTCNPPYMKVDAGKQNQLRSVTIARHELCCSLYDCICAAAYLLPSGGRFYMVHRPERLTDILAAMREKRLEPKRLTVYTAGDDKPPRLLVVEGQKNRSSGLIVRVERIKL